MKIGDYVRTKGYITKIDSCTCWETKNQWYISYKLPDGSEWCSTVTGEFKISPNLIDLIEVGDYVNGSKVVDISILKEEKWVWVEEMEDTDNKYGDDYIGYNNEQIKSIVTKEQFENMEYKV